MTFHLDRRKKMAEQKIDLTAEMKKQYETGQAKIADLKAEIAKVEETTKGAKAYLLAIGAIEKTVGSKRGRKPKQDDTKVEGTN